MATFDRTMCLFGEVMKKLHAIIGKRGTYEPGWIDAHREPGGVMLHQQINEFRKPLVPDRWAQVAQVDQAIVQGHKVFVPLAAQWFGVLPCRVPETTQYGVEVSCDSCILLAGALPRARNGVENAKQQRSRRDQDGYDCEIHAGKYRIFMRARGVT